MFFKKYISVIESGNPKKSCATCKYFEVGHTGEDANDVPYTPYIHCSKYDITLNSQNTTKIKCESWSKNKGKKDFII